MKSSYIKWALVLSLAGSLFSGYLSFYKLFAASCAFNEPCPIFLGYPACWYGFAMFATLLAFSLLAWFGKIPTVSAAKGTALVSVLGILFAGRFTLIEVLSWLAGNAPRYSLGLPTCAYGLIFYIAMCAVSFIELRRAGRVPHP